LVNVEALVSKLAHLVGDRSLHLVMKKGRGPSEPYPLWDRFGTSRATNPGDENAGGLILTGHFEKESVWALFF
jgi:hypothetical protein